MSLDAQALRHAKAWNKRPSRAAAKAIYGLLQKKGLSVAARSEALVPLGEAAELDCEFAVAHAHFVSVIATTDPLKNERLYVRAAARCLLNAPRLHQVDAIRGVAKLIDRLPAEQRSPRLAWLGALARGLSELFDRDIDRARKAFEEAMGAAWESGDPEAEAIAHHLLGQAWVRLAKVSRARQHIESAHAAGVKSGLWLLAKRLELEKILFALGVRLAPETLNDFKRLVAELRKTGFPRLESIAWSRLAQCSVGHPEARLFLDRAEKLIEKASPQTPDRLLIRAVRRVLQTPQDPGAPDGRVLKSLTTLAQLARSK